MLIHAYRVNDIHASELSSSPIISELLHSYACIAHLYVSVHSQSSTFFLTDRTLEGNNRTLDPDSYL